MKRHRPRLLESSEQGTIKEKSVAQEKRMAIAIGGKVQPGSGSSQYAKGDVKHRDFLIECKRTDKKSMRVKGDWLKKITQEAVAQGRIPALHIEVDITDHMCERDWVAVPLSVFKKMIGEGNA